ncbi:MAG TPA: DUF362 domain-containing protein [Bryobacteraceae bacterium]|nr:DUF362 domain-containing protein [Bryobacteraceae bacterium]
MSKKTTIAIAHSDADLGRPAECTREQLDIVKGMVRDIADQTMGGMSNIVKRGDKVLIKINTVIPVPANEGFTTDPRMLEALIELVQEQNPAQILIGERCAMGGDTRNAMEVCGMAAVAQRTGAELCPFDDVPFDMYKIDRPISFNEFPVPRPVRDADVYIGLPKMKVHVHTTFTGAMKLQFGNLPDYDWMVRCHRDDIYQKICNLTRAANPKWFVMDSLYACQGNGPFSAYRDDLIKDFNTMCGGPDPVAVDTVCEALMDWDAPGTNVPSTVLGNAEGLGTNNMDEIELTGAPLDKVKRRFRRQTTVLQGPFPNVNVIMGSTCEAGCKAIVRMQLDQAKENGTLAQLKRPLYVFTGLQFEEVKPVDGDVILVGDCAKPLRERFPDAKYWGSNEEFPNCTPIWANIPARSISNYIRQLAEISK